MSIIKAAFFEYDTIAITWNIQIVAKKLKMTSKEFSEGSLLFLHNILSYTEKWQIWTVMNIIAAATVPIITYFPTIELRQ